MSPTTAPAAEHSPKSGAFAGRRLMVFGGRSHPRLADGIATALGVQLGEITLRTFPSTEVYCRLEESIRGADVFLVQPTCANPEAGMSANDALMELLVMADAAVGASAHRVIAVTPWFGYARQDKKSAPREPISTRVVARALESVGVDRVVAVDLHAGQVQGFFEVPLDHLTAQMILAEHIRAAGWGEDLVVVAPDAGRVKLTKNFAKRLGADLALLDKNRPEQEEGALAGVIGEVEGKTAIVVDDMIDTATTLCEAAEAVVAAGAAAVHAVATHGLFSPGAYETVAASPLGRIVVADTVPLPPGVPDNVEICSCTGVLADCVRRIFTGDSVSEVFEGQNQVF